MKKKLFIVASFFFGLSFFACAREGEKEKQPTFTQVNQTISEAVKKELSSFLEIIPVNMEKDHGFNNRSEFTKAVPTTIYRVVGINQAGNLFETNLYNVVVAVNNEYRAVLTVAVTDGNCEIESIGAAELAKELQLVEKQNPLSAEKERIMLNVLTRSASFVSYKDVTMGIENATLIPLESAKTGLNNSSTARAIKSTYTLTEALEAFEMK